MAANSTWVYKPSGPISYSVGYYAPDGAWVFESEWTTDVQASTRVHYLNGGIPTERVNAMIERLDVLLALYDIHKIADENQGR